MATITPPSPLTWTVNSLTNGVAITFRVTAIGAGNVAGQSRTVTVTPSGLPGAPTGLVAANSGTGSVLLNWVAPTNTNGQPLTGYAIQYRSTGSSTWTVQSANTNNTGTYLNITGLNSGSSYDFEVAAINGNGTGAYGTPVTLVASGSASAPTITALTSASQSATITWSAPSVGSSVTISGYNVDYSTDGTNWSNVLTNGNVLTYTISSGLTNGTNYLIRVAAVVGGSAGSYAVGAITPTAVPGAPTISTPTVGAGSVQLVWTSPSLTGGCLLYTSPSPRD